MGSYNQNSRSGGRRYGGGGGGGFRRRDSGRREMHKAVCDECGNSCEVPFRPSGDKPIYCSDCFETKGGGDSRRSGRRDDTNKQLLEQVRSLNNKLDRILNVIESCCEKKSISTKAKVKKKVIKAAPKDDQVKEKKAKKKVAKKSK